MLCECTDDILTFAIYSVASNIVLLYVNNISLPPRDVATLDSKWDIYIH